MHVINLLEKRACPSLSQEVQLGAALQVANYRSLQHLRFPKDSASHPGDVLGEISLSRLLKIEAIVEMMLRYANRADDQCAFPELEPAHQILTARLSTHSDGYLAHLSLTFQPLVETSLEFTPHFLSRFLLVLEIAEVLHIFDL